MADDLVFTLNEDLIYVAKVGDDPKSSGKYVYDKDKRTITFASDNGESYDVAIVSSKKKEFTIKIKGEDVTFVQG